MAILQYYIFQFMNAYALPFPHVFFNFFHPCFRVFSVQIFYLLNLASVTFGSLIVSGEIKTQSLTLSNTCSKESRRSSALPSLLSAVQMSGLFP
jgi:hypothetical protein